MKATDIISQTSVVKNFCC